MSDAILDVFARFLNLPAFDQQPAAPTVEQPRYDFRRVHLDTAGEPELEDIWSAVALSDSCPRIRRANADLTPPQRFGLYARWIAANHDSFLFLERTPADQHGTRIVGKSIILPLRQEVFDRVSQGQLKVIALGPQDICRPGAAADVLLYDTWVMHNDYQAVSAWFRYLGHRDCPFTNALPLRHLSMLWAPGVPLRLCAEPDSQAMLRMATSLGFTQQGVTAINEPLLALEFPPCTPDTLGSGLQRRYQREVVRKIRDCAAWTLK